MGTFTVDVPVEGSSKNLPKVNAFLKGKITLKAGKNTIHSSQVRELLIAYGAKKDTVSTLLKIAKMLVYVYQSADYTGLDTDAKRKASVSRCIPLLKKFDTAKLASLVKKLDLVDIQTLAEKLEGLPVFLKRIVQQAVSEMEKVQALPEAEIKQKLDLHLAKLVAELMSKL